MLQSELNSSYGEVRTYDITKYMVYNIVIILQITASLGNCTSTFTYLPAERASHAVEC